mmetsp:Transcript_11635/g.27329  ORF Transcript_11635/g.27329 Transcript_11635/m.27329 type:complete len:390 (+) Transcript_11635:154-1323(+)
MHVRVEQEGRRRAESGRQRPELHAPAQGHGDAGRDERRAESRESVRAHREERMREEHAHEMPRGARDTHPGGDRHLPPQGGGRAFRHDDRPRRGNERRRGASPAREGGRGAQRGGHGADRGGRVGRGRGRRGRDERGREAGDDHGDADGDVREARRPGRGDGRDEGEGDTVRSGVHARHAGEAHEGLLGGVEDEGQPGEGVVHTADAAAAGRADQPPRHGGRHLARGLPLEVEQDPAPDLALAGLPQQRHDAHDPLHAQAEADLLRRKLRPVRQDEVRGGGEPAEAVQLGAGPDQEHEGVHREVRSRHEQEREAGAVEAEGARQDGTGGTRGEAGGGEADELQVPRPRPPSPAGARVSRRQLRLPEVRAAIHRRQLRRGPGQPRRPCWA